MGRLQLSCEGTSVPTTGVQGVQFLEPAFGVYCSINMSSSLILIFQASALNASVSST